MHHTIVSLILSFFFLNISPLCAQDATTQKTATEPAKVPSGDINGFDVVKKEHSLSLNDKNLPYESLTGTLTLKGDDGKEKANIFFTAYFLKDVPPGSRPITFCFNGGPGSASLWLHMGLLGPKKVIIKDATYNAPPGRYEDNPYTLLDSSDLVFVDPVSTGFSTAAEGVDAKQFHGVEEDITSIAEFIRHFVTKFDRWGSPKFLLGESYGTIRVVGLAEKLSEKYYMNINGLALVSACLDLQALGFDSSNDLSYILTLPSITAAAQYHKKIAPDLQAKKLQELLAEVEEFALGEYASALLMGDTLPEAKKQDIAVKLARYTGLSADYVMQSALRIRSYRYYKELLRSENKLLGWFDTRITGLDQNQVSEFASYDPSLTAVASNFASAYLQYVNQELDWKKERPYYVINPSVNPWNWGCTGLPAGMGYLNLTDQLKSAIIKNPALSVFIGSGYYDLVTPYFSTDYTVDHLQLPPGLQNNVERHYYEAGHMMYTHLPSLVQMKKDLSEFIQKSS